jgi:hypothetical protein
MLREALVLWASSVKNARKITANNTKVRSEGSSIRLLGHTAMPHCDELKEIFGHEHQWTNGTEHTHVNATILVRLEFVGRR